MSLVVDRINCIEESGEWGSDDIYLIVFQGRTVPPFDTGLNSIGPGNFWDDFDTGEKENTDHRVASTNADAVYAVMMVDKDDSKDITGSEIVSLWHTTTDLAWKVRMASLLTGGISPSSASAKESAFVDIRSALKGLASTYMAFPFGNDDVIDVKRVTISQPGQSQVVQFHSPASQEDATYDVTFKHTTAA